MTHTDTDRVDGRELEERDEPGSDDLLLRGLLLSRLGQDQDQPEEGSEPA